MPRYKNDPEVAAMTGLVDAYQRREVHAAEKILRGPFNSLSTLCDCSHFLAYRK
jgi:hypothetical protein